MRTVRVLILVSIFAILFIAVKNLLNRLTKKGWGGYWSPYRRTVAYLLVCLFFIIAVAVSFFEND